MEKKENKKNKTSSKQATVRNTIIDDKIYDESEIVYVDKLLLKAMKTSGEMRRIKYSIVSTDDTNEIINLMSMAKIGQRALVHISPQMVYRFLHMMKIALLVRRR